MRDGRPLLRRRSRRKDHSLGFWWEPPRRSWNFASAESAPAPGISTPEVHSFESILPPLELCHLLSYESQDLSFAHALASFWSSLTRLVEE
jgi:hypothetical protein